MAKTTDKRAGSILSRARYRLLGAVRSGRAIDEEMLEETLGDAEPEERREPAFENRQSPPRSRRRHDRDESRDEEEEEREKRTEDRIKRMVADAMAPVLDAIDARLKAFGKDKEKEEEDDKGKDKEREETEDNEKILGHLELEAPPGTNDRARKARDGSFLADPFRETVALAEVLCPGIRTPTFDSAALPRNAAGAPSAICVVLRSITRITPIVAVRQTIDHNRWRELQDHGSAARFAPFSSRLPRSRRSRATARAIAGRAAERLPRRRFRRRLQGIAC